MKWRRVLSPRKASLQEDWILRGLTLHQLKDIIADVYVSKAKADARLLLTQHTGTVCALAGKPHKCAKCMKPPVMLI